MTTARLLDDEIPHVPGVAVLDREPTEAWGPFRYY